jgi:hypothetical protein
MTNAPKEIPLRYVIEEESEIQTTQISWSETPRSLLIRLDKKENCHILDAEGQEFPFDDNLFGYASLGTAKPVKIVHGLNRGSGKKRVSSNMKDNRERIEVRFGDTSFVTGKGPRWTYASVYEEDSPTSGRLAQFEQMKIGLSLVQLTKLFPSGFLKSPTRHSMIQRITSARLRAPFPPVHGERPPPLSRPR